MSAAAISQSREFVLEALKALYVAEEALCDGKPAAAAIALDKTQAAVSAARAALPPVSRNPARRS